MFLTSVHIIFAFWASLVVQWLTIHLVTQGHRFYPLFGKILHAMEQLSPQTTTNKARTRGGVGPTHHS